MSNLLTDEEMSYNNSDDYLLPLSIYPKRKWPLKLFDCISYRDFKVKNYYLHINMQNLLLCVSYIYK